MRLWSFDPEYLDSKGLGAVWREGLLAQSVLLGKTKGWKKHSHLLRFKKHKKPISAIGFYLLKIYEEARKRGYNYNKSKIIDPSKRVNPIKVTKGQLLYELHLLLERLKIRSPEKYNDVLRLDRSIPIAHPLFIVVEGTAESWEKSYWVDKI